jgi:hypothetical protein
MPLHILAPMVIAGIALAVVLVRLTVNHAPRLLADKADVIASFTLDYPMAKPNGEVSISQTRDSAILSLGDPAGAIGFVETMGSKRLTRLWCANDISRLETTGSSGLRIELRDFTLPHVTMQFGNPRERDAALVMLKMMDAKPAGTKTSRRKVKPT